MLSSLTTVGLLVGFVAKATADPAPMPAITPAPRAAEADLGSFVKPIFHQAIGVNTSAVDLPSLAKRQSCSSGYEYCSGGCMVLGDVCCPNGSCDPGESCCGSDHCHPKGTECCSDESYCEVGNMCVRWTFSSGNTEIVCCTDTKCTAVVVDGSTSYRTTSTRASYRYYYITITWTYYYFYWSYSYAISASVVTSSRTTSKTILSVYATDSSDAYDSLSDMSRDLDFSTPAAATSLATLAGETSRGLEDETTTTSLRLATASAGGGGGGAGASGSNRGVWAGDHGVIVVLLAGLGAGAAAVLL